MRSIKSIIKSLTYKQLIAYTAILVTCIAIIGIAVYFSVFYYNDKRPNITITDEQQIREADIERRKTNFTEIFSNSIIKTNEQENNIKKIDNTKDIVFSIYEIDMYKENKYDLNINLPAINIDSNLARKINKEIINVFGKKVNSIAQSSEVLSTYNIDYVAFMKDDILSLVIKATLKELDNAQRVIIKTYNYNINTDEEIELKTLIEKKNLDANKVYQDIIKEIEKVNSKNDAFATLGYEVRKRNTDDVIYLLENTNNFFIDTDDYLYLIYAYGNNENTSEMDIVIF